MHPISNENISMYITRKNNWPYNKIIKEDISDFHKIITKVLDKFPFGRCIAICRCSNKPVLLCSVTNIFPVQGCCITILFYTMSGGLGVVSSNCNDLPALAWVALPILGRVTLSKFL